MSASLVLRFMLIHECNDHIKEKKEDIFTILWDLHGEREYCFSSYI